MKLTSAQMIDKLNSILSKYNQTIRVIAYSANSLELSSGTILVGNNKYKFCRRIMYKHTTIWIENMDQLMSGEIDEKIIKSKQAAKGGKAVQKKHGNIIKKNLNTGIPWNAGTKGQNIGNGTPRPQAVKDVISKKNSGINNGMYGVKMSSEYKEFRSALMKKKILEGTFTPLSNNRNTHWNSYYKNKKYRSSWEALYQYFNESAEYESLRIEYELYNEKHIYIVDFIDHNNKIVVEVKPKNMCVGEKFMAKKTALDDWAKSNGYTVLFVDHTWLINQKMVIDYTYFDDNTVRKIKKLYEIN
jgi:very-short-patch-repair endonuclease